MKIRKRTIILTVVVGLVAFFGYSAYANSQAPKKVTTEKIARGELLKVVSASGKVQSQNTSELSFTGTGRISSLPFKEGDEVKKGQVLAYLDGSSLKQQENKAWADYRLALEKLREFENNNKDKPKTDTYMISKAQLEAQRDAYSALVGQTRTGYQDRTLISPISGIISSITADVGETPGSGPVITVVDPSALEFVAEVDEQDIGTITLGLTAEVFLDSYSGKTFSGSVTKIETIAKTGTSGNTYYPVRIGIQAGDSTLLVGMNGDGDIQTAKKDNVVLLPLEFIQEDEDVKFVYVIENSKVTKRTVTTGLESDIEAEVISGLTEGESIISGDTAALTEGQAVEVENKK